jgi:hypothetical protein
MDPPVTNGTKGLANFCFGGEATPIALEPPQIQKGSDGDVEIPLRCPRNPKYPSDALEISSALRITLRTSVETGTALIPAHRLILETSLPRILPLINSSTRSISSKASLIATPTLSSSLPITVISISVPIKIRCLLMRRGDRF